MKKLIHFALIILCLSSAGLYGQASNPSSAPYCNGGYTSGNCNQPNPSNTPGNFINDFINCVQTTGANTNINNCNSGCNGNPNNFGLYCSHYLLVNPGQTVTVSLQSGNTFAQGFAIFVDWDQDNTFAVPTEQVAGTTGVPAAGTFTTLTFTIPAVPPGAYRMRIRCAFATPGVNITPCGTFGFGETEDYNLYVGSIPPTAGIVSATASVNSPICALQTASFNAATSATAGITYSWTGPGGYTNTSSSFVFASANPSVSGIYTLTVNNGNCPNTQTVELKVIPYASYSINPASTTICQGGSVTAQVTFTGSNGPGPFTFSWSPAGFGVFNPSTQTTPIFPPLLPTSTSLATIVYSVTVIPTQLNCPATRTIAVTINNPFTPTLTMSRPLCTASGLYTLTASPPGGVWSNNSAVSPSGVLNPAIATISTSNTVRYTVAAGSCSVSNTGTFAVYQFNTASLTNSISLLCSQDAPINLMNIVQNTLAGQWNGQFVSGNPGSPISSPGSYFFNPTGIPSGTYNLIYSTTPTSFDNGVMITNDSLPPVCYHSVSLPVVVFNPPTPTIVPIAPRCNNGSTVALTAQPALNGVWSGNSGISANGVLTPSNAPAGAYSSVMYSSGIGTCVATASAPLIVARFNPAALSGSIANLCVKSNPFNLLTIVQSTVEGRWFLQNPTTPFPGSQLVTNLFDPIGRATDTYVLTYSTAPTPTNLANLCSDTRTIAVHVLNPPQPNITQVGPFCSVNNTVQLSVSPANSGTWTPFTYMNVNGVFTPSLSAIGGNVVQYVTGTSTCNAQQTKTINVEAFVPATITNQVPDLCNTNLAVSLLPITQSAGGTWTGTGILGSNFSPAVAGAGVHVLTYNTASSPSGLCPDQATVAVSVFSLAPPVVAKAGPFCNTSLPVKLQVTPVGGIFTGANNGAITSQGLFNPALGIVGNNIVSYSIASGPCVAFVQTTLAVEKFVSADLTSSQPANFCQGDDPVNLDQYIMNPGGLWVGPGVSGNRFDPKKANLGSNNLVIYKTHSANNALLCPDTSAIRITVSETPTISLTSPSGFKGCAPVQLPFDMKVEGGLVGGKATWYIGDGSEPEEGLNINPDFNTPGVYTLVASYVSEKGCKTQASLNNPVEIYASPKADFSFEPQEITVSNPDVTLNNLTAVINNHKYLWSIQGMNTNSEINPKVSFPRAGSYKVNLLVTSYNGCTSEITKYIEVKNDFNVFIPSSFSPNGDGINDVFYPVFTPYGLDARTFEMDVFDRWGHVIYHTKDINKGWDGSLNNKGDATLKQDSYIYKIRFKDMEGRLYEKIGNFTLLGS